MQSNHDDEPNEGCNSSAGLNTTPHPPQIITLWPMGGHRTVLLPRGRCDSAANTQIQHRHDEDECGISAIGRAVWQHLVSVLKITFTYSINNLLMLMLIYWLRNSRRKCKDSWCFYVIWASVKLCRRSNGHDLRPFQPPIDPRHCRRQ